MSLDDKLPVEESPCPVFNCVYNEGGICDDPLTNKGNVDAICHDWDDDYTLKMLEQNS